MSDRKDEFKAFIERSNKLRELNAPKEGLIGQRSDEQLSINLSVVPEGVRIQSNRPIEDICLQPEHATSLGLALIQNAVMSKLKTAAQQSKPS